MATEGRFLEDEALLIARLSVFFSSFLFALLSCSLLVYLSVFHSGFRHSVCLPPFLSFPHFASFPSPFVLVTLVAFSSSLFSLRFLSTSYYKLFLNGLSSLSNLFPISSSKSSLVLPL